MGTTDLQETKMAFGVIEGPSKLDMLLNVARLNGRHQTGRLKGNFDWIKELCNTGYIVEEFPREEVFGGNRYRYYLKKKGERYLEDLGYDLRMLRQ